MPAYPHSDAFPDVYSDAFTDFHSDAFPNAHSDAFPDGDADVFSDVHSDAFADGDADAFPNADSKRWRKIADHPHLCVWRGAKSTPASREATRRAGCDRNRRGRS